MHNTFCEDISLLNGYKKLLFPLFWEEKLCSQKAFHRCGLSWWRCEPSFPTHWSYRASLQHQSQYNGKPSLHMLPFKDTHWGDRIPNLNQRLLLFCSYGDTGPVKKSSVFTEQQKWSPEVAGHSGETLASQRQSNRIQWFTRLRPGSSHQQLCMWLISQEQGRGGGDRWCWITAGESKFHPWHHLCCPQGPRGSKSFDSQLSIIFQSICIQLLPPWNIKELKFLITTSSNHETCLQQITQTLHKSASSYLVFFWKRYCWSIANPELLYWFLLLSAVWMSNRNRYKPFPLGNIWGLLL